MTDEPSSELRPPIDQEDAFTKVVDQLGKEVDAYRQSTRELDKWLTTSLLAMNGGALIAVANLDWLPSVTLRAAGQLLVAGLVVAFLAGGATAHIGRRVSILYTELIASWGGRGTEAAVTEAQKILKWHVQVASVLRVVSLLAFLGAIYTVSEALPARPSAEVSTDQRSSL